MNSSIEIVVEQSKGDTGIAKSFILCIGCQGTRYHCRKVAFGENAPGKALELLQKFLNQSNRRKSAIIGIFNGTVTHNIRHCT
jgi:hypothetical protein